MLAYVLALTVGLGSVALYLAAFFFPEIHRKNDFIWSGVGLFYALVLWIFAQRITGGLLLGHVASVALLGWFGWETLSLRRQVTPQAQQTQIPSTETVKTNIQEQVSKLSLPERLAQVQKSIGRTFSGAKDRVQTVGKKTPEKPKTEATPPAPTGKSTVEIVDQRTPVTEQSVVTSASVTDVEAKTPTLDQGTQAVSSAPTEAKTESVPEAVPPNPPSRELVEAAIEAAVEGEAVAEELAKIPVEEIAPDAALAPPAEAPPGEVPPNPPGQSS